MSKEDLESEVVEKNTYCFEDNEYCKLALDDSNQLLPYKEKISKKWVLTVIFSIILSLFSFCLYLFVRYSYSNDSVKSFGHNVDEWVTMTAIDGEPMQVIENNFERIPLEAKVMNTTVYEKQKLVNGLSATFSKFEDFEFDSVFLTLNFTNNDNDTENVNVIEISIDGHPVWRTSPPLSKVGTTTYSSTSKDISKYISLFGKSSNQFKVQILEGSHDKISFALALTLANCGKEKPVIGSPITVSSLFNSTEPANDIIALTKSNGEVFDFSKNDKFLVELPKFSGKTFAAKLELFVSAGKSDVEFFILNRNSPFRLLNIFINEQLIATISPNPILFHSNSIIPSAYSGPIAPFGSFTGFSYEVNLANVLPILWGQKSTLEVQLVSPVNDMFPLEIENVFSQKDNYGVNDFRFSSPAKPIMKGDNQANTEWYVSGNIFLWENKDILTSQGEILGSGITETYSSSLRYDPRKIATKILTVSDDFYSSHSSTLRFSLRNQTLLNFTVNQKGSTKSYLTEHQINGKISLDVVGHKLSMFGHMYTYLIVLDGNATNELLHEYRFFSWSIINEVIISGEDAGCLNSAKIYSGAKVGKVTNRLCESESTKAFDSYSMDNSIVKLRFESFRDSERHSRLFTFQPNKSQMF